MPESGLFLVTLFLAVEERVTGSHGCETKTSWMTVSTAHAAWPQAMPRRAAIKQSLRGSEAPPTKD
jgi:hypothetical protein